MRSINGLTFFVRVKKFQSPRSGKFVSDEENKMTLEEKIELFQSPRSGEFVSNKPWEQSYGWALKELAYFNPLDQGNLYQIMEMLGSNENSTQPFQSPRSGKFVSNLWASKNMSTLTLLNGGFNPLDRGNLYQIALMSFFATLPERAFQSPRSGKFVSDILKENDQDFEWYPVSIP